MALGTGDLFKYARDIIQDVGMEGDYVGDRHSDEKLVRITNAAITVAYRLRPDLFFPGIHDRVIPEITIDNVQNNDAWPLDSVYWTAFAEYLAGVVGLGDDEFAQDQRAVTLMNRFTQKLTAKGA